MSITPKEINSISEIANVLYSFLPANPHPYANKNISFLGCANKVGLGQYWTGGSKKPAISQLLRSTLEFSRGKFCQLIVEIVNTAIIYRANKEPITREEIELLNNSILGVQFKIPELHDLAFLSSLPSKTPKSVTTNKVVNEDETNILKEEYIYKLPSLPPKERGFAFEKFLSKWFKITGLDPRASFRNIGEQIDGSFQYGGNTYLVEAKWEKQVTRQADLLVFKGKIDGKSTWSRGVFISYLGFSKEGLEAFTIGK